MKNLTARTSTKYRYYFSLTRLSLVFLVLILLSSCVPLTQESGGDSIAVQIEANGNTKSIEIPSGITVQAALEQAGITVNSLDRIIPPSQTLLTKSTVITLIRVTERFEIEEQIIPFQRQTVRNESLPEGQTLLIQPGINGIQQITYRIVEEDGVETSNTIFKSVSLSDPLPEIIMVGVQNPLYSHPHFWDHGLPHRRQRLDHGRHHR